jgi:hypothetical protein
MMFGCASARVGHITATVFLSAIDGRFALTARPFLRRLSVADVRQNG